MEMIMAEPSAGASILGAGENPKAAIEAALAELEAMLKKFIASGDIMDRMALLTEVEALRRYVLVRNALVKGLQKPAGPEGVTLGKLLCRTLQSMIGDVPKLVTSNSLQGARNMERDTRRAIASLTFLGSLDPDFV